VKAMASAIAPMDSSEIFPAAQSASATAPVPKVPVTLASPYGANSMSGETQFRRLCELAN